MNNRVFRAFFAFSLGLVLLGAIVPSTQAQSAKSGTFLFYVGAQTSGTVLQLEENHIFWHGSIKGWGHNPTGDFLKNHRWECYATNDIKNGMADANGYCTITDPDGDNIFVKFSGKYKAADPFTGVGLFYGGTGKYEGISGRNNFQCNSIGDGTACINRGEYTIN